MGPKFPRATFIQGYTLIPDSREIKTTDAKSFTTLNYTYCDSPTSHTRALTNFNGLLDAILFSVCLTYSCNKIYSVSIQKIIFVSYFFVN